MTKTILVIDDDEKLNSLLKDYLSEFNFKVITETNPERALNLLKRKTPDIIILDEIFSGLDPINIELIKNVLLKLKREGRTILFSTHVMEQAEKLCDHICMISQGQKVLDGTIGDVKAQFGRNAVQIGFEGDGKFIRDLPGVREMTEFNNYVEVRLEDGTKPDSILKAAVDKLTISRFEVMEPSLYDIFIDTAKIDPANLHAEAGGDHV